MTAAPYAGSTRIPLEPEPIYSRRKGEKSERIATYDAEFRAGFDRKITDWACDFMTRSTQAGKPFYVYLPYTQVHIPPIPDPQYAGTTQRGNWADILTQMDAFTGTILDKLDELGIRENTIVVWASDNGADTTNHLPAIDPDPVGGQWHGFSGPWRGGLFTGKYDCMVHSTSSAVRGHHTASSNPKSTGLRCSGSLPRCHLPHIPVAYPASESAWAIVTSHRVIPSGPPVRGTVWVPERIAWRPVSKAERLGVQCASTLKFSNLRPSPARSSIRGVGAPRSTPPP
ncbi:sulfatase-like hydrolase/transferase [Rhodococcus opacus]|nr:sulfatase-like hydrolase/transferase [Rhodococcus opacus]